MKLFNKIRDFFYDEEEVTESEEPTREVKEIVKEEKEVITERTLIEPVQDETFKFPVVFDEKDFEPDEKLKKRMKKEEPENTRNRKKYLSEPVKKEEKKFKPTPIISPVYGVLDKNYKAGDINQPNTPYETTKTKDVDLDSVREKAFGTLADDLEKTLHDSDIMSGYDEYSVAIEKTTEFDILENMNSEKLSLTNYDLDEVIESRIDRNNEESSSSDNTDDLFELINSMYDKDE